MKNLILILVLSIINSTPLFAQSVESFFKDDGVYELSKYTHPDYKHKVKDTDIDVEGNYIIIEVTYDGRMLDFTDKYKIGFSNNRLTSFVIKENGSAGGAFTKWLISTNECDSRAVNEQDKCAAEKCLQHLNKELSKR